MSRMLRHAAGTLRACEKNRVERLSESQLHDTECRATLRMPPATLSGPIRGALFDMCNVLYDATVWRRWVLRLLSRLGVYTNYHCFFRVWDREYLGEVQRGDRDFWEAFESFLRSVGLSGGQIDEVKAASTARRRQLEKSTHPLPGVRTTLGRLHKAGLVLGVACDSFYPSSFLRECLDRFAVGRMFSVVVSSLDLKRTMPDPIVYRTALDAMNLPPEEVVFVGHDAVELEGATAMGMPTVAFNFDPNAKADVYITCFNALPEVLETLPPLAAAS